jgi:plastocyanin
MSKLFSTVLAVGLLAVGVASASPSTTITIRHQMRGCHTWAVNNGAYKASQSVAITRGGSITFVDNDIMPHKLVQLSGPALKLPASAYMHTMGAKTTIHFAKAGVYKFTTKAGEDYMSGMKTIGEDNVLKLTVVVH